MAVDVAFRLPHGENGSCTNGFGIKGVPGTFCVADLSTSDQDGADFMGSCSNGE
jgi:hypothetical protein